MASKQYLETRIARTQAAIEAYEDAIEALANGAQSYQLDTGQTRQLVTKAQLSQMVLTLQRLENRLEVYEARLSGASSYSKPGY